jgi:hypothetical protein
LSDLPVPTYSTDNLLIAAILLTLYRRELPYLFCRYRFDLDQYHFFFRADSRVGAATVFHLQEQHDNLVPARAFKRAFSRLYREFQEQQRANGNPQRGGGQR